MKAITTEIIKSQESYTLPNMNILSVTVFNRKKKCYEERPFRLKLHLDKQLKTDETLKILID